MTTVANQVAYALPFLTPTVDNDWIRVTDMLYNSAGTAGAGGSRLSLTDRNQLRRFDPTWTVVGAGTPYCYYHTDPNTVALYPPPSASAITLAFQGIREAPLLVNETDTPTFPKFWHDAIPLIAQYRHLRKYNPTPNALRNYMEGIDKAKALRREIYGQQAPAFQIRLQPEPSQRTTLGGFSRRGYW